MNKFRHIITFAAKSVKSLLAAGVLTACSGTDGYYGDFRNISPDGWDYNDKITFIPELTDSVFDGSLAVAVRHTNDYLYSNIYIEVAVKDSIGQRRDTFNIALADEFGRWYGRGIGTDYQLSDTVYPSIRLHSPAMISVRHIMRSDKIKDIQQIGIALDKK